MSSTSAQNVTLIAQDSIQVCEDLRALRSMMGTEPILTAVDPTSLVFSEDDEAVLTRLFHTFSSLIAKEMAGATDLKERFDAIARPLTKDFQELWDPTAITVSQKMLRTRKEIIDAYVNATAQGLIDEAAAERDQKNLWGSCYGVPSSTARYLSLAAKTDASSVYMLTYFQKLGEALPEHLQRTQTYLGYAIDSLPNPVKQGSDVPVSVHPDTVRDFVRNLQAWRSARSMGGAPSQLFSMPQ